MNALIPLTVLVVAVFAVLGLGKVFALAPMRARAEHLGVPVPAYRAIGTLEIAGAVGVALGLVAPLLGRLAGAGLLLLLAGALAAHLRHRDRAREIAPAVVAGLLVAAYLTVLSGVTP